MMRPILGIKFKDRIKSMNIQKKLPILKSCTQTIENLKRGWAGYVARLPQNKWTYQVTVWFLGQKARKKERKKTPKSAEKTK